MVSRKSVIAGLQNSGIYQVRELALASSFVEDVWTGINAFADELPPGAGRRRLQNLKRALQAIIQSRTDVGWLEDAHSKLESPGLEVDEAIYFLGFKAQAALTQGRAEAQVRLIRRVLAALVKATGRWPEQEPGQRVAPSHEELLGQVLSAIHKVSGLPSTDSLRKKGLLTRAFRDELEHRTRSNTAITYRLLHRLPELGPAAFVQLATPVKSEEERLKAAGARRSPGRPRKN